MMLQRIRWRGARRADHLNGPVLLQIRFQEDIAPETRKGEKELQSDTNSCPSQLDCFTTGLRRGDGRVTETELGVTTLVFPRERLDTAYQPVYTTV